MDRSKYREDGKLKIKVARKDSGVDIYITGGHGMREGDVIEVLPYYALHKFPPISDVDVGKWFELDINKRWLIVAVPHAFSKETSFELHYTTTSTPVDYEPEYDGTFKGLYFYFVELLKEAWGEDDHEYVLFGIYGWCGLVLITIYSMIVACCLE